MHYQQFGLSRGHDAFSGEEVSAFKEHQKKKKKESKLKMLDSRRPLLIYDCSVVFFISFIPTGHLVGSNRTAALDFVDISEQCVFVRSFWCVFVC